MQKKLRFSGEICRIDVFGGGGSVSNDGSRDTNRVKLAINPFFVNMAVRLPQTTPTKGNFLANLTRFGSLDPSMCEKPRSWCPCPDSVIFFFGEISTSKKERGNTRDTLFYINWLVQNSFFVGLFSSAICLNTNIIIILYLFLGHQRWPESGHQVDSAVDLPARSRKTGKVNHIGKVGTEECFEPEFNSLQMTFLIYLLINDVFCMYIWLPRVIFYLLQCG